MSHKLLVSACLLYSCTSLHAASILSASAAASCSGITNEINGSVPTGPLAANPAPCSATEGSASASALADYGQLSGSSAFSGHSGGAYSDARFTDHLTILNGPANGYLRMFYSFAYSGQLAPGSNPQGNWFRATATFLTSPSSTFGTITSVGGTWSSTVAGFVDYDFANGYSEVTVQAHTDTFCSNLVGQSGSCSVSAAMAFNVTGWQVLDANLAPDSDAIIQAESGASYAAPEPGTGLLLMGAAGIFYFGRRFTTRCPDASA